MSIMNDEVSTPLKVGISSCLLGEKVRYDAGHKLDRYIRDTLGQFVQFVPVCPEVECGLPTPRESMRLVGDVGQPRLVTTRTGVDLTEKMQSWSRGRIAELEGSDLCGFIFKKGSPSSGMERVKVYDQNGVPQAAGSGLFAKLFMEKLPLVPVEDEGRLHDPVLRENFVERIFTLKRWREMMTQGITRQRLVEFHTRHKYLIYAHSQKHLREMGKIVADLKSNPPGSVKEQYLELLMTALKLKATTKKHTNVLMHMMGYFKKDIESAEKQELLGLIDSYRQGLIPLIVPITLLKHYVNKYDQPYLKQQYYIEPHPMELMLRNHA